MLIPHNEENGHPKKVGGRKNQIREGQIRPLGRGPKAGSAQITFHEP